MAYFKVGITILIIALIFSIASISKYYITTITFKDNMAQVSPIYCKFISLNNLPDHPVILIPGLKGSILEKNGKKVWISPSQGLINTNPLFYIQNDGVKATGIFTKLTIIPFLLEYNVYNYISAQLACRNGYFFYYDWRDYPQNNVKKLGTLVDRVINETGKVPSIISHSMGTVIAHAYLKDNTKKINKVVYVSGVFNPAAGYFPDMDEGGGIGLNKEILSPEALFTHPASYLLLPHKGNTPFENYDLMNAKTWRDNKFGKFRNSGTDTDVKNMQKMMDNISEFHKFLDTPRILNNKALVVISECHPTFMQIKNGEKEFEPGDGRVDAISPFPNDDMPIETYSHCERHDLQLENKVIVKKIFDWLNSN